MKYRLKRNDLILCCLILAAALLATVALRVSGREGAFLVVYTDGEESARYPLREERTVTLNGFDTGYNRLVIRGGEAYLEDADCPDRLCVRQGAVSKAGESIICLPHRIVITIEDGKEAETDTIAQ